MVELRSLAVAKGGACLSDEYLGMSAKYRFRCSLGHEWESTASHVLHHGRWCRVCANARTGTASRQRAVERYRDCNNLQELQSLAVERGGACLSTEYQGWNRKYRFRCGEGHEWAAREGDIREGTWCRRCANASKALGIEAMRQVAQSRGGRCLSEEYQTVRQRLQWQCARGHVWSAVPDSVLQGHWCPSCAVLDKTRDPKKRRKYESVGL